MSHHAFGDWLTALREQIDQTLGSLIADATLSDHSLAQAIHYSTLLGGKRVRPALVIAAAQCFGAPSEQALLPACAVELLHTYSLVHDDLPAMDDDDLRRGQPSCHRAFDEATAILAGDALQTLAFEVLSRDMPGITTAQQVRMIHCLAKASGARGMVQGQALDLEAEGQHLKLEQLETIHRHKTGALIEASVLMGAQCAATPPNPVQETHLRAYASAIGLAFQVQDDILDVIGDTQTLGKSQGADAARGKSTYPALLGLEGARRKLDELHQQALTSLSALNAPDSSRLADIADFIVSRIQ